MVREKAATAASEPHKLRKGDRVVYKELNGRLWRAAIVMNLAHNGEGVKILFHNGKSICDLEANTHLLRAPTQEQNEDEKLVAHWTLLMDTSSAAGPSSVVAHEPLYCYLQRLNHKANKMGKGDVRILSWNVKHFGATHARIRTHDPGERELLSKQRVAHDDERARNLAEVIHQSRCTVVVLQEVAKSADVAELCRLLDERDRAPTVTWHATEVVGEHVMLYCSHALAASLGCTGADALKVEAGLYARGKTLSADFRAATAWESMPGRIDFAMEGASAARLPAFFFAHNGRGGHGSSGHGCGRSLAICSVHLAFGAGGVSDTRTRQLENLASLTPGVGHDPTSCLFALLGDFNSNATVRERGHDFASSDVGKATMERLNGPTPKRFVSALPAGQKTSIGGERYDEIIVHGDTLGNRSAHVFPKRDQLVPHMRASLPEAEQEAAKSLTTAFSNILSDHLPVFVDLEFKEAPSATAVQGAAAAICIKALDSGDAPPAGTAAKGAVMLQNLSCKSCAAGKGCRWRGREGHLPPLDASGATDLEVRDP